MEVPKLILAGPSHIGNIATGVSFSADALAQIIRDYEMKPRRAPWL